MATTVLERNELFEDSLPTEMAEQKAKAANNKSLQLAVNNAILAIGNRDK